MTAAHEDIPSAGGHVGRQVRQAPSAGAHYRWGPSPETGSWASAPCKLGKDWPSGFTPGKSSGGADINSAGPVTIFLHHPSCSLCKFY